MLTSLLTSTWDEVDKGTINTFSPPFRTRFALRILLSSWLPLRPLAMDRNTHGNSSRYGGYSLMGYGRYRLIADWAASSPQETRRNSGFSLPESLQVHCWGILQWGKGQGGWGTVDTVGGAIEYWSYCSVFLLFVSLVHSWISGSSR